MMERRKKQRLARRKKEKAAVTTEDGSTVNVEVCTYSPNSRPQIPDPKRQNPKLETLIRKRTHVCGSLSRETSEFARECLSHAHTHTHTDTTCVGISAAQARTGAGAGGDGQLGQA
jgi:hypothetical protein